MMLSTRRFWCVVCLAAVAAGGMLIEPARQYAKRAAIKYVLGGSSTAADVQLHRQQELLEIIEPRTTQFDDEVQVIASADVALVKLDMPTLLDKRFVSSRVKVKNVRIQLASIAVQKPATVPVTTWQKSLEEVMTALQWDSLRDECEALLKSDSVLNEFDKRMRGWLLRSQQIMFHGDQLTRTVQAYSNPLRHQTEIRNQLAQLEQLRLEQDSLQKQFNGVNAVLASQMKGIESLADADVVRIRNKCELKSKSLRSAAAEQLVKEWANQLTRRQLQLSQSVATLLQSNSRTNPFDVDVRSPNAKMPLLSLSGIDADGFLCDSSREIPFAARGEYSTIQKSNYQLGRRTQWEIQLEADQTATEMKISSGEADSAWLISSTSQECAANSSTSATMMDIKATLKDRELSGQVRMNLGMYRAFSKLPCAGNTDLALGSASVDAPTADGSVEEWIAFDLAGSAFEPRVVLATPLPANFTARVTKCIQTQMDTQRLDSESKLKIALKNKVDELSNQLNLVAKRGERTLAEQRETLSSMHRELEQTLQSRESVEYARLPSKANANH